MLILRVNQRIQKKLYLACRCICAGCTDPLPLATLSPLAPCFPSQCWAHQSPSSCHPVSPRSLLPLPMLGAPVPFLLPPRLPSLLASPPNAGRTDPLPLATPSPLAPCFPAQLLPHHLAPLPSICNRHRLIVFCLSLCDKPRLHCGLRVLAKISCLSVNIALFYYSYPVV
jgi:hypothetical protein